MTAFSPPLISSIGTTRGYPYVSRRVTVKTARPESMCACTWFPTWHIAPAAPRPIVSARICSPPSPTGWSTDVFRARSSPPTRAQVRRSRRARHLTRRLRATSRPAELVHCALIRSSPVTQGAAPPTMQPVFRAFIPVTNIGRSSVELIYQQDPGRADVESTEAPHLMRGDGGEPGTNAGSECLGG